MVGLLSRLTPNQKCKYVRGTEECTFVKIDIDEQRLYTKTPMDADFTFAQSYLKELASKIEENIPFNTSQLLNNKGSNRAVIDSIIAHTEEFYWLKIERSIFTVWVPSKPHEPGKLVEWKDAHGLDLKRITIGSFYGMTPSKMSKADEKYLMYIIALRTKPFMLLAGISGTGKSRLVRELAFKSCPEYLQDADGTTPGNYCMIEVKPNWHDSTELLGYYSRLGKGGYQFTKFVKFLMKAKMFPDVPFFVCLDEMNLAPVEQYFAEILSILETRKHPKGSSDTIKTEVIIDAHYFKELERSIKGEYVGTDGDSAELIPDRDIYMKLYGVADVSGIRSEVGDRHDLTTEGLTLPDNVLIIGTVNMDDTTHQFSRKVIDRAMTIEMNGGRLADMYGGSKDLEYLEGPEQEKWQKAFKHRYVTADEVIEKHPEIEKDVWEKLPERLEAINNELKGTPFTVSYRVLNELTIMVGVLLDEKGSETNIDDIINQAVDYILLMKILPRIEGDREMFAIKDSKDTKLSRLLDIAPQIDFAVGEKSRPTAKDKIKEMIDRLDSQEFTRFWP